MYYTKTKEDIRMKVNFNVKGADRKALAHMIGEKINMKPVYKGMPSAAYQIGDFTLNKDGSLEWDDKVETSDAEKLVETLVDDGFEAELESLVKGPQEADSAATEEVSGLTISIPLDRVNAGNLTNILEAKGTLIKQALGVDDIRIFITEDTVAFPWFDKMPDADEVYAYSTFISCLCKMSIDQKRVSSKEKEIVNPKYEFRCFLLRLGMIGDQYKTTRKILLRNLSGSSAFKTGSKKEGEE